MSLLTNTFPGLGGILLIISDKSRENQEIDTNKKIRKYIYVSEVRGYITVITFNDIS